MTKTQLSQAARKAVADVTPSPRTRAVASNHFFRVISLWEAIALHGNGAIPTITETLRGSARGWRDQTWPRRIGAAAMIFFFALHLFGGYPKKYVEQLEELQRRAAGND